MPSVTDQGIVGYMCNTGNNYPYNMGNMRIITGSCANMNDNFNNGDNLDDAYLIHPGYKVVLYRSSNYSGNTVTLDNTNGQYLKMFKLSSNTNKTSSFKSYYKGGNELPDMSSSEMYVTGIVGPSS